MDKILDMFSDKNIWNNNNATKISKLRRWDFQFLRYHIKYYIFDVMNCRFKRVTWTLLCLLFSRDIEKTVLQWLNKLYNYFFKDIIRIFFDPKSLFSIQSIFIGFKLRNFVDIYNLLWSRFSFQSSIILCDYSLYF